MSWRQLWLSGPLSWNQTWRSRPNQKIWRQGRSAGISMEDHGATRSRAVTRPPPGSRCPVFSLGRIIMRQGCSKRGCSIVGHQHLSKLLCQVAHVLLALLVLSIPPPYWCKEYDLFSHGTGILLYLTVEGCRDESSVWVWSCKDTWQSKVGLFVCIPSDSNFAYFDPSFIVDFGGSFCSRWMAEWPTRPPSLVLQLYPYAPPAVS